jgi:hypothetical protein
MRATRSNSPVSLLNTTSGSIDGAARRGSAEQRGGRAVESAGGSAHPCPGPDAFAVRCNRRHRPQGSSAGGPRQRRRCDRGIPGGSSRSVSPHADLKDKPPFVISRIVFGTNVIADAKLAPAIEARNITLTTDNALAPKSYDEYHVFVRLAEPGHYYVEFRAPLAKTEYENDPNIPRARRTGGAPPGWKSRNATPRLRPSNPRPLHSALI